MALFPPPSGGGPPSRGRSFALRANTQPFDQQQIITVQVERVDTPFYMRSEDLAYLDGVLDGAKQPPPQAAVIAPLDNLLWERQRVKKLFGMDYIGEVYKPVAERHYGYYVLPILYGDRFIARFEPERDKQNGTLVIKSWWWEPDVAPTSGMQAALRDCFRRFLGYLGADSLQCADTTVGMGWLEM